MKDRAPSRLVPAGERATRLSRKARIGILGALVIVVLGAVGAVLTGGGGLGAAREQAAALADAVPYDGRSPLVPAAGEQRVLVGLSRPPLGELDGARTIGPEDERRYLDSLEREQRALRSALEAGGVHLRDVVSLRRVWNGFAATVRTRDLARVTSLGARAQPVRRFYPATSDPTPVAGAAPSSTTLPGATQAPIAVLATGIDAAGAAGAGYDAVDRDRDTSPGEDPRDTRRREADGTALAGVLAAAGERVLPIRVAGLRTVAGGGVEAVGTSDELLVGLERAVDPDADGDTGDHAVVALVGVNSPYAGFADAPEAEAVRAVAGLGTLVVTGAGEEGAGREGAGTIGSPGAAPGALTVGATTAGEPLPRMTLESGGVQVDAAVLGGAPPAGTFTLGRPGDRSRGRVVVARAGNDPPAAAAKAATAGAGARVVILADPAQRSRPLPAVPAGRTGAPVVGVTGDAARRLLERARGAEVTLGLARRAKTRSGSITETGGATVAPASSSGPTPAGAVAPQLVAPGSALTLAPGGGAAVAGGTALAAARVAVAAAKLARARPDLSPALLAGALIASARPERGLEDPARAGAGALRDPAAVPGGVVRARTAAPEAVAGADGNATLRVVLTAPRDVSVTLTAETGANGPTGATGARASVTPATLRLPDDSPRAVQVSAPPGVGRLVVRAGRDVVGVVAFAVRSRDAAAATVGPLTLTGRRGGRARGVRLTLGAFTRGDPLGSGSGSGSGAPGTRVRLTGRLDLTVTGADGAVRSVLTPPGGARDLMPAEYAYTVPASARTRLGAGSVRFRARARDPENDRTTTRRSPPFRR